MYGRRIRDMFYSSLKLLNLTLCCNNAYDILGYQFSIKNLVTSVLRKNQYVKYLMNHEDPFMIRIFIRTNFWYFDYLIFVWFYIRAHILAKYLNYNCVFFISQNCSVTQGRGTLLLRHFLLFRVCHWAYYSSIIW